MCLPDIDGLVTAGQGEVLSDIMSHGPLASLCEECTVRNQQEERDQVGDSSHPGEPHGC